MLAKSTLICIHGYGVRGFFWEAFAKTAINNFRRIITPDLSMTSVEDAIEEIKNLCRLHAAEDGQGVILMGHSLGGVLSALAAKDLSSQEIQSLVIIACPYGSRDREMSPILRFLLFRKLIPGFLIRKKFFGRNVPRRVQKDLFARAVKETPQFQLLVNVGEWFHNDLIKPLPGVATLAISSVADKIVPASETAAMAAALHCDHISFSKAEAVGHDDFGVSPQAATLVVAAVRQLLE